MLCRELFEGAGLECPTGACDICVSDIVCDSRQIVENCIFICLSGSKYDGHEYIEDAIEAGAKVIVAEKVRDVCVGGAAIIYVDNTRRAASLLYNAWFGNPANDMKIVGITGTNGKTSVSYMLLDIFEKAGYNCGLIGTVKYLSVGRKELKVHRSLQSNMTTPDPKTLYSILARMRDDGAQFVFMEVSSHALSQCRTDAITFDTAVFTNLTEDHLDFHKSMEEYYGAKRKLFLQSRRAVINADDAAGRSLFRSLQDKDIEIFTCSRSEGDFCALSRCVKDVNIEYSLKCPSGVYRVSLPLSGEFQIMNSLEAAAVAIEYGIRVDHVCDALKNMGAICGRMEELKLFSNQDVRIFIDYAHTPDALQKLLQSVRGFRKKESRILLLFGCGGERERDKRKLMGQIASRLADVLIITSDNSRGEDTDLIISDILKGIDKEKEYTVIKDRREAIECAVCDLARAGDIVLLAGKGHEKYQINKDGVHPFDEREIVERAIERRYK